MLNIFFPNLPVIGTPALPGEGQEEIGQKAGGLSYKGGGGGPSKWKHDTRGGGSSTHFLQREHSHLRLFIYLFLLSLVPKAEPSSRNIC